MENSKTKLSKGLKRLLAATIVVAVAFLACFIVLALFAKNSGDPDLANFVGVLKYHLHGLLNLVLFRHPSGSNIVYFALSAFLYALFVCWVIFLIAGIIINDKKNTSIMAHAIALSFISFLIYVVLASGAKMYWHMMNGEVTSLKLLALVMVALTALYFLLSIIFYFWCVIRCFLAFNAYKAILEEYYEEDDDEFIRRIVRDELIKNQPFKVIIVGNESQEEEAKPEPAPVVEEEPAKEPELAVIEEPKKEEPKPAPVAEKKVIYGTIDFWQVARTVWPQLDNPKPLPREEKAVIVPEPAQEEEEEGWNRNKRQPFFIRVITAETETKVNYNELKNESLSYGVKARLSRGGETFRLKDKKYVKIYLVGKTLKVYLALSPEDYKDSTIPIEDVGHRPNYAEMPLLFKVRSQLSVRRCKELIKAAMEKDGLTQGEVKDTNWVDELRVLNAEKAKKQKAQ